MIDAVLSYHLNPLTCGVAKFNVALAARLGVPCLKMNAKEAKRFRRPLFSVKDEEYQDSYGGGWVQCAYEFNAYELFFHDTPELGSNATEVITRAWRVFAGNADIAVGLRPTRPDVIAAFCPATVAGESSRGAYRVLVYGMSHKLNLSRFEQLKAQLDVEHSDYTIELSTAVHEGSPWDQALTESTDAMRAIFGDHLRVLGFLGDDALAKELQDCDAVAAYFTPALRANNTSAWAALAAGKHLYTNVDEHSPALDPVAHSWDKLVALINA